MSKQETMSVATAPKVAVPVKEQDFSSLEKLILVKFINRRRRTCETIIPEGCRQDKCFICPKENTCKLWQDEDNDLTSLCPESGRKLARAFLNNLKRTSTPSSHDFAWESHMDLLLAPAHEVV